MNWLRNWVISKILVDGFKSIEKTNWMTSVMTACFKQSYLQENWIKFCDSCIELLKDAIDEITTAKKWEIK